MKNRRRRFCRSKAEGMLGSAGANPRPWPLHKHDIWLLVRFFALITSEHLRSEPQPDHNVLPRGDSAGGRHQQQAGYTGVWTRRGLCLSACCLISLLKSCPGFINWWAFDLLSTVADNDLIFCSFFFFLILKRAKDWLWRVKSTDF